MHIARALLACLAGAGALSVAAPAGHAQTDTTDLAPTSVEPEAGSVVDAPPDRAQIAFDSPLEAGTLTVYDESGQAKANADEPTADGVLEAVLPPLPDGTYLTAWTATDSGGTSGSGGYVFHVDTSGLEAVDARAAVSSGGEEQTSVRTGLVLVQVGAWAGALLLVGTWLLGLRQHQPPERRRHSGRILWTSWGVAFAFAVVGFAVEGLRGTSLGLGDALDPSLWREVMDTSAGVAWLGALIVLGFAAPAIAWNNERDEERRRPLAVAVGTILSLSLLGCLVVATPVLGTSDDDSSASVSESTDTGSVELTLSPARIGSNEVHLYLFDSSGLPVEPEDASLRLRSLSTGVGPIDAALVRAGPNHFLSYDLPLPFGGEWQIEVVTTSADGETAVTVATVEVS